MKLSGKLRAKFSDPADPLLQLLEKTDEKTRIFQPILVSAVYTGTIMEAMGALPAGKQLNDVLLWNIGQIAGCGQNESGGKLRYNAVGGMSACIQNGTAEAIAELLENNQVAEEPFLDGPATIRRSTSGQHQFNTSLS